MHHTATTARNRFGIMSSLLCLAALSLPLRAADSHMSTEERTQVLKWLDESHQEFLAAIAGVSDAQWKWKSAPEQWSVGETAEHIVLAEALLFAVPGHETNCAERSAKKGPGNLVGVHASD